LLILTNCQLSALFFVACNTRLIQRKISRQLRVKLKVFNLLFYSTKSYKIVAVDGAKLATIYSKSGTFCLHFAKVFKFSTLTSGGVELREICWGILIVAKDGQQALLRKSCAF
jgi:hypothetical protein